jgi:hypothetical protein
MTGRARADNVSGRVRIAMEGSKHLVVRVLSGRSEQPLHQQAFNSPDNRPYYSGQLSAGRADGQGGVIYNPLSGADLGTVPAWWLLT